MRAVDGNDPPDEPNFFERAIYNLFYLISERGRVENEARGNSNTSFDENFSIGMQSVVNDMLLIQGTMEMVKPSSGSSASSFDDVADDATSALNKADDLAERAITIQNAQPAGKGRNVSTTAVAEVVNSDGSISRLVGSSRERLTPAQRAMLIEGEVAVKGKGHAEVTVINAARANNQNVTRVAASRPICDNCADEIIRTGVKPASPLKNPDRYNPFLQLYLKRNR